MLFLPFIAKAQAEVGRWSIRPMVGVSASYYTHGNNAGPYNSYAQSQALMTAYISSGPVLVPMPALKPFTR